MSNLLSRYRVCVMVLGTLLLGATPALAVAPPSRSFLQRPTLIPIEVVQSGHIAIWAKINGHGPYRFIFDTGAPSLVISEQVAHDAKILPSDYSKPFFTPLGNLGNYDVHSIELGRATQSHLTADIWNHPTVEILGRAFGRFEGLIGFPFFARYQVTIDYKSKTMTLVPCDFQPADTQQRMTERLSGADTIAVWSAPEALGIRIAKSAKDQAAGVDITNVFAGSAAATAGMEKGDRLLTLDGRWTDSIDDCYAALCAIDGAREVPITISHAGKPKSLSVHVGPGI